ncbi:ribulose-phosphate 3-epimerase [Candidatus Neomarinimicrobiota bacterium]
MEKSIIIAPSILSADFSQLRDAVAICQLGGAEYIHVDVMDGHFVPNLTIGPVVVKALRPYTKLFLDVHLMVTNPEDLVEPFAKAGADGLTFHIETASNPDALIKIIRSFGIQVGISIKPKTSIKSILPYLDQIDLVLIMSVEPGFGGQKLLSGSLEKIEELSDLLVNMDLRNQVLIEVDGGIKTSNYEDVIKAGADILVAGSAVFGETDPVQVIKQLLN